MGSPNRLTAASGSLITNGQSSAEDRDGLGCILGRRPVSRRVWMLLIPEVLVVALALGTWLVARPPVLFWLDPRHNSNARYYLSHTRSQHDFRRIGSRVEGTCRCNLAYLYIGPAATDPTHVFTGPGLTLAPWPPGSVGDTRPWDFLLHGTGNIPQTGYSHRQLRAECS